MCPYLGVAVMVRQILDYPMPRIAVVVLILAVFSTPIVGFALSGGHFAMALLVAMLLFFSAVLSPAIALAWLLITVPYFGVESHLVGVPASALWGASFTTGIALNLVFTPSMISRFLSIFLSDVVFFLALLALLLLSVVWLSPDLRLSALSLPNVFGGVAVLFCVSYALVLHAKSTAWLVWGLLCSGILAFGLAVGEFRHVGLGGRLSLHDEAGGVRALANASLLGVLALIYVAAEWLGLARGGREFPIVSVWLVPFILMLMLIGPVLSVSRGVIFAILAVASAAVAASAIKSLRFGRIRSAVLVVFTVGVLVAAILLMSLQIIFELTGGAINRLLQLDLGSDRSFQTRVELWFFAFRDFSLANWLIGGGLGTFRLLSFRGMYEHSVFVSILYSTGLLGALIFISVFLRWLVISFRYGTFGLFMISTVAGIFMFSTHGTVVGLAFWVFLGVLCGVAYLGSVRILRDV